MNANSSHVMERAVLNRSARDDIIRENALIAMDWSYEQFEQHYLPRAASLTNDLPVPNAPRVLLRKIYGELAGLDMSDEREVYLRFFELRNRCFKGVLPRETYSIVKRIFPKGVPEDGAFISVQECLTLLRPPLSKIRFTDKLAGTLWFLGWPRETIRSVFDDLVVAFKDRLLSHVPPQDAGRLIGDMSEYLSKELREFDVHHAWVREVLDQRADIGEEGAAFDSLRKFCRKSAKLRYARRKRAGKKPDEWGHFRDSWRRARDCVKANIQLCEFMVDESTHHQTFGE